MHVDVMRTVASTLSAWYIPRHLLDGRYADALHRNVGMRLCWRGRISRSEGFRAKRASTHQYRPHGKVAYGCGDSVLLA